MLYSIFHMLEAIERVASFTTATTFESYRDDDLLRLAVERCIEIISEASRSVPDEIKLKYNTIPWPDIAAIGNILRHDYDNIRSDILWNLVERDLPVLKVEILKIAADQEIDLSRIRFRD